MFGPGSSLYTATYLTGNETEIYGIEIPVSLPDMPPEEEMINFGIPKEDQVWYRFEVPREFRSRAASRMLPWQKVKRFVDEMWHRRRNGEWWLINGHPVYIPGSAWLYFNFWQYGTDAFPDFKIMCVWWFQFARHVERDNDALGILELKPRRSHATEMSLCWLWDIATKYRDSNGGIMSKSDDDAALAFDRMTFSNERMIWFFKPKNKGTSRPADKLDFQYPPVRIGSNTTDIVERETPEVNSHIWFEPTVEGKFDGVKLRAALFDEIGKIPVTKMNIFRQWKIMQECMTLDVGTKVIGKCCLPSTIEDLDDGRSIDIVQKMWDQSNPNRRNKANRTVSGLLRMFRPYWFAASVDKYGWPIVDSVRATRQAQIDAMEAEGLHDDVVDYKHKYPETVEEALSKPSRETLLPTPLIDRALEKCRRIVEEDMAYPLRAIPGSLEWTSGFGSKVRWMPNPQGRWHISRHPDIPNNSIILPTGHQAPGSTNQFGMGVDPVDLRRPDKDGSDGACTVGSLQDYVKDAECVFDENDILVEGDMWSDSCCCDYSFRPELPEEFFEDMLKTAIYYGCRMLVEKNKPGLINWGYAKGYGAYFAQKPAVADTRWMNKNVSRPGVNTAIAATEETIQSYYGFLRSHLLRRSRNYTHPRLLNNLRKLTDRNRTECDLAVSWGWTLTLLGGMELKAQKKRKAARADADMRRSLPLRIHPF